MSYIALRRPHLHPPPLAFDRRCLVVAAIVAAGSPGLCACSDIEPAAGARLRTGAAEAVNATGGGPTLAHEPTGSGVGINLHEPRGLCSTLDILPVTLFYAEFDDSLGSHYHGWKPPAGPPFYVCCGGPCAIDGDLP